MGRDQMQIFPCRYITGILFPLLSPTSQLRFPRAGYLYFTFERYGYAFSMEKYLLSLVQRLTGKDRMVFFLEI